ncbi:MBL fold metallo-hydrolase [Rubrobacter taiwanensis]|jgi:hydroxyacylglutathione hydrolase|uniref:MBL fold metallo-hydrolase n=1 Tax=Rubrobacter taiwanensis TaxID=185139 RepID=A0A4R1BHX2_9ACTN|nr:MBL fold metallo-hydrolase [Rubrobacter taiwanensis]TCJ16876.1 MBL fold metallo-hydrolase [Rubrobacter taiwanensis]
MLFERVYDEDLAQAGYFVGCQATGEAIVVDPRRDVGVYLELAGRNGMRIVAVTETHIHADYLSGSRELAAATGAALYLSDEGDEGWKYAFEGERLRDGDEIKVGNILVRAVHTPGHTPEHLSFLITDGAAAGEPGYILTGDFVFVGDLGRPDLLDEAAGGRDTRYIGAKQMFISLKERFLTLPDYVQVWPGHGAGSACGKALGAVPVSTVGYERTFAWWSRYIAEDDEAGFVEALLEGQPDAPAYFGRMKRQNKSGPALLGRRPVLRHYEPREMQEKLRAGEIIFIDTRGLDAYLEGAVPGALHVPGGKSFASWAAWVIDPEKDGRPIVLLARDEADARRLRDRLSYVGIDNVEGYVTNLEGVEKEPVPTVSPGRLEELEAPYILDVRARGEFSAGHIPGANQLHGGRVLWNLGRLPKEGRTIITHCQSGARSAVVASMLRASGFENVLELEGGYDAWRAAAARHASA